LKTFRSIGILFVANLLVLAGCANPGTPMGGPKDEEPPKVRKSTPAPNAFGYNKNEIRIEFDELIVLKDINQKLVVSPPMNTPPTVTERGNELVVEFQDSLQDNTTYTLDFADAIVDNNEGNILPEFRFSFSTGQIIDSLQIAGNLFQAGDVSPVSGALVFVHKNLSDSAFNKLVPVRLAKTDEAGRFTIPNVSPGTYRIYALEDANRDYKYDQPGERIAWLDSLVVPSHIYRTVTDSLGPDSVATRQVLSYTPDSLKLFMFAEERPDQYITSDKRGEPAKINMTFKRPAVGLDIQLLGDMVQEPWSIIERNPTNDSISIWITNNELFAKDTLQLLIGYATVDSLLQPSFKSDTISFYYFKPEEKKKKRGEVDIAPMLQIGDLRSSISHFGMLGFTIPTAPVQFIREGLQLNRVVDSVLTPMPFEFVYDSALVRRFRIKAQWEPGANYEFKIDSATIKDVYGLTNNKVNHRFTIRALDSYGTAYITIINPQPNWLLQIVDGKNVPLRQSVVPANGKMAFRFLPPGELAIRLVVDVNGNGKWDSGDYKSKTQPETVLYYPDKVAVRANWDHEVKWDPSTFDIYKHSEKFIKNKSGAKQPVKVSR
jgi:uncharacterized protein (DUF2141 family)